MTKEYNVYVPSGNPTALVIGIEEDMRLRKRINDTIEKKYNIFVEQVGFVNEDKHDVKLLMAGGEFCGNAARCAIYYYLDGKPGNIDMDVLGVNLKLRGGIDDKRNVWVSVPVKKDYIMVNDDNSVMVKLPGITHVIVEYDSLDNDDKAKLDEYAKKILEKYDLFSEVCAGVMYIKRDGDSIRLLPYVYIREVNTWFLETACGTGTIAFGMYESNRNNRAVDMDIIQPSRKVINIKVDDTLSCATLSGKVTLYDSGKIIV